MIKILMTLKHRMFKNTETMEFNYEKILQRYE